MKSDNLLAHISETEYLLDAEIISESNLDNDATFVIAKISFEPGMEIEDMIIPFVYYPGSDILFSPCDWQGELPKNPDEISKCEWRLDVSEVEAVMFDGLPMLTPWTDNPQRIKQEVREYVGEQIRKARKSQGLTTRQLAEKCGLSHSHIIRVEQGRYAITIDTIAVIAKALGLEITLE